MLLMKSEKGNHLPNQQTVLEINYLVKADLPHSFQRVFQKMTILLKTFQVRVLRNFFTKNRNVSFHELENTFDDVTFIFNKRIEMRKGSKIFVLQLGITIALHYTYFGIYYLLLYILRKLFKENEQFIRLKSHVAVTFAETNSAAASH